MAQCIRGHYDFYFGYSDCKTLLYQDLSEWMVGRQYEQPDSYKLQVKVPGRQEFSSVNIDVGSINQIDSHTLSLGGKRKMNLPDGVYCFKVENCGKTYMRHGALTCKLECCVHSYVSSMTYDQVDPEFSDRANNIRNRIDSIHYNADLGKVEKAKMLYRIAKKEIEELNCEC